MKKFISNKTLQPFQWQMVYDYLLLYDTFFYVADKYLPSMYEAQASTCLEQPLKLATV
jgi:hypothetical protein